VPFEATGRNEREEIIEDLHGTALIYEDDILVVVDSGRAQLADSPSKRSKGISTGLGYRHANGGWDFRVQSETMPISSVRHRGDTLDAPISFRLHGTRGLVLADHWIIIQQHALRRMPTDGLWYETTRPIDSEANVFVARPTPADR